MKLTALVWKYEVINDLMYFCTIRKQMLRDENAGRGFDLRLSHKKWI